MKSLYNRGRQFIFHLLTEGHNLGLRGGGVISANLLTEEATEAHVTGLFGQGVIKKHAILATCKKLLLNEYLQYSFS